MSKYTLVSAVIWMTAALAFADEHTHPAAAPTDSPIKITINPEARVSVTLGGALPPPVACGTPVVVSVKVVNQGFVTSRLEAELVGSAPAGASLQFHPAPLKGIPEELRELRITLVNPGLADLTIAFRSRSSRHWGARSHPCPDAVCGRRGGKVRVEPV